MLLLSGILSKEGLIPMSNATTLVEVRMDRDLRHVGQRMFVAQWFLRKVRGDVEDNGCTIAVLGS
jgi:hypothetical protein